MHLTATDGTEFTLHLAGYEFPEAPDDPGEAGNWDANWLVVEGSVRLPDGRSSTFRDPCLLTSEARALGAWLVRAGAGKTPEPPEFLEPVLAFALRRADGVPTLLVTLAHEATPQWAADRSGTGYVVPLTITDADLAAAAGEWADDLRDYPRRAVDAMPQRSSKTGKAPQTVRTGQSTRGDFPRSSSSAAHTSQVNKRPS